MQTESVGRTWYGDSPTPLALMRSITVSNNGQHPQARSRLFGSGARGAGGRDYRSRHLPIIHGGGTRDSAPSIDTSRHTEPFNNRSSVYTVPEETSTLPAQTPYGVIACVILFVFLLILVVVWLAVLSFHHFIRPTDHTSSDTRSRAIISHKTVPASRSKRQRRVGRESAIIPRTVVGVRSEKEQQTAVDQTVKRQPSTQSSQTEDAVLPVGNQIVHVDKSIKHGIDIDVSTLVYETEDHARSVESQIGYVDKAIKDGTNVRPFAETDDRALSVANRGQTLSIDSITSIDCDYFLPHAHDVHEQPDWERYCETHSSDGEAYFTVLVTSDDRTDSAACGPQALNVDLTNHVLRLNCRDRVWHILNVRDSDVLDVSTRRAVVTQGEKGEPGVGFVFVGAWSVTRVYTYYQVVKHKRCLYFSTIVTNQGNIPDDRSDAAWTRMVCDGNDGESILVRDVTKETENTVNQVKECKDGKDGAAGAPGTEIFFSGEWLPTVPYAYNDIVRFRGCSWLSREDNTNCQPDVSSVSWGQLSCDGVCECPLLPSSLSTTPSPPPPPPASTLQEKKTTAIAKGGDVRGVSWLYSTSIQHVRQEFQNVKWDVADDLDGWKYDDKKAILIAEEDGKFLVTYDIVMAADGMTHRTASVRAVLDDREQAGTAVTLPFQSISARQVWHMIFSLPVVAGQRLAIQCAASAANKVQMTGGASMAGETPVSASLSIVRVL